MIHVDRSRIAAPEVLTGPNSPGVKETEDAIKFYENLAKKDAGENQGNGGNNKKTFSFKVYKHPEVVNALEQLFHRKCAYCESSIRGTGPIDVEHFRPKSAVLVSGRLSETGYYWLAANWDNLLPSCIDCNRARTQELFGSNRQVLGKANQFPIADEDKRAKSQGQENQEEPLLLNPCLDDPDQHLEFNFDADDAVVVLPALEDEKDSPMGQESIRVYGLMRTGLVQERGERMKTIKAHWVVIDTLIKTLDANPGNPALDGLLKQEMAEVKRLLADDQEYAGMGRQFVKKIMGG